MRLICPNCDAQYEVPDDVIPPEGRDVQCSNCGKTWFQVAAGAEAEDDFDPALGSAQPLDTEPEAVSEPVPQPEAPPEPQSAPEPQPDLEPEPEPEPASAEPQPAKPTAPEGMPEPRKLDPEVASVLREEAERETRVRAAERGAVESQPDLGLDDMSGADPEAELREQQARSRMDRMRGKTPEAAEAAAASAAVAAAGSSRRELLPDIEEINSTLRSTDQPRQAESSEEIANEPQRAARSSFRRGFFYVLLLAIVAAIIYIYEPLIAEAMPGLAPALESYVTWVDGLRGWLDAKILAGLQWLDGMAAEQPAAVGMDGG